MATARNCPKSRRRIDSPRPTRTKAARPTTLRCAIRNRTRLPCAFRPQPATREASARGARRTASSAIHAVPEELHARRYRLRKSALLEFEPQPFALARKQREGGRIEHFAKVDLPGTLLLRAAGLCRTHLPIDANAPRTLLAVPVDRQHPMFAQKAVQFLQRLNIARRDREERDLHHVSRIPSSRGGAQSTAGPASGAPALASLGGLRHHARSPFAPVPRSAQGCSRFIGLN
jgi:hypothetical protein